MVDTENIEQLTSQNMMIGMVKNCLDDEPQHTIEFEPGDRLLVYTDGLTETVGADNRYLGTAGLCKMATDAMSVGLFDAADYLLDRIARYQHGPAEDDKTLIVAEMQA